MKIKNVDYETINRTLKGSIKRAAYPMTTETPPEIYKPPLTDEEIDRAKRLAKKDSGHNNYLKGIIVQFDLCYTQYHTPQLQRYNWIDIVSSQSKMHRIHKMELEKCCNYYVHPVIIGVCKQFINLYNSDKPINTLTTHVIAGKEYQFIDKKDLYMHIISCIPLGFQLWMGITTNYLQLRTIYKQRNKHKLEDWSDFCVWIESLPMSNLITE